MVLVLKNINTETILVLINIDTKTKAGFLFF